MSLITDPFLDSDSLDFLGLAIFLQGLFQMGLQGLYRKGRLGFFLS